MTKSQSNSRSESEGSADTNCPILEMFADTNRLKISRDECGETIILGRHGQVYEYGYSLLGVMFMPAEYKPRLWGTCRRSAVGLGMGLLQNGDAEGTLAFDPDNDEQVKLALKIARVKRRRKLSAERIEQLSIYLQKARNSRTKSFVEWHLRAEKAHDAAGMTPRAKPASESAETGLQAASLQSS